MMDFTCGTRNKEKRKDHFERVYARQNFCYKVLGKEEGRVIERPKV